MRPTPLAVTLAACLVVACGGSPGLRPSPSPAPSGGNVNTELRLHAAATAGDLVALEALITAGARLDARDGDGRTAVMAATAARQAAAVRVLLDAGADVDIRDDRLDNPFLYAGAEGLLDILRLANEAGADPAITNRFGGIALIPAAERGHVEVVRYLLAESDVDVDHVNKLGWTALLEAIILSDGGPAHREIVALLIEHGADVDLADRDGVTPLAHARARGYAGIAALLEAEGAGE
ncbi:MAG TPA: ankyrin repeat domain-containing protein [Gaiellaceae bacterium]|nr:ankyrin repeat domain-containing protein [Gaiellaceae bacterium]